MLTFMLRPFPFEMHRLGDEQLLLKIMSSTSDVNANILPEVQLDKRRWLMLSVPWMTWICIHFKDQNPRRDDVNKIGKCLYQSTSFVTDQIFHFIPSLKPQEL